MQKASEIFYTMDAAASARYSIPGTVSCRGMDLANRAMSTLAATMPIVYCKAMYCLEDVARIQAGNVWYITIVFSTNSLTCNRQSSYTRLQVPWE